MLDETLRKRRGDLSFSFPKQNVYVRLIFESSGRYLSTKSCFGQKDMGIYQFVEYGSIDYLFPAREK